MIRGKSRFMSDIKKSIYDLLIDEATLQEVIIKTKFKKLLDFLKSQGIDFNKLLATMQAKEKIDTIKEFKKRYKGGQKSAKMLMEDEQAPFDRLALINQCCPAGALFQYCQNTDDIKAIVGDFPCPEGCTPSECARKSLRAVKIVVAKEQFNKVLEGNEKTLEFLALNLLNQGAGALEPFHPAQWVFVPTKSIEPPKEGGKNGD